MNFGKFAIAANFGAPPHGMAKDLRRQNNHPWMMRKRRRKIASTKDRPRPRWNRSHPYSWPATASAVVVVSECGVPRGLCRLAMADLPKIDNVALGVAITIGRVILTWKLMH
jgi:hypothetical protein